MQVGLPSDTLKDNFMNGVYKPLTVQKMDFFLNVNYGVTFLKDRAQTKLKSRNEDPGLVIVL